MSAVLFKEMNLQPQSWMHNTVHVLGAHGMLMFLALLLSGTKLYVNVRSTKRVWKPVLCPALIWFPVPFYPLWLSDSNNLSSSFWSCLLINKHRNFKSVMHSSDHYLLNGWVLLEWSPTKFPLPAWLLPATFRWNCGRGCNCAPFISHYVSFMCPATIKGSLPLFLANSKV